MTISTTTSRITYAGDGITVSFAVPFIFFGADEIGVIERSLDSGNEVLKVLTTDYNVAGGSGATGTVTALIAPGVAKSWTIARKTQRTQMVDYTPNDPFPAETHERALDRLTALVQELDDKLGRAAALSPTSTVTGLTLPDPDGDKLIGWKADMSGLENKSLPGGTTIYAGTAATRSGIAVTESVTPSGLAALWRKGSDIASAGLLVRPSDGTVGGYHVVTGDMGITALWNDEPAGAEIELRFAEKLTLTHDAISFILPNGIDITTTVGDVARFRCEGDGKWRCVSAPPNWFGAGSAGLTLQVNVKTSSYTMLPEDLGSEIMFTTGGTALALLPAASAGNGATLVIRNATVNGIVTINPADGEILDSATSRTMRAGDNVLIRSDGTSWRTVSGYYSFESTEQTLSLGAMFSVAHGLGETPNWVQVVFRCKTAEANWAVGNEIDYNAVLWTYGSALHADAANLRANVNQTYYPAICNKSTGIGFTITGANWRLVFRAKCMKG